MKIGVPCYPADSALGALLFFLFLTVNIVYSQGVKTPFDPVAASKRPSLAKRLNAYTNSFRNGQWGTLYDLVSDQNRISVEDGKDKVYKHKFISAMQNTYEMRHLQKFTPVRTESGLFGYDIYGCGEVPGRDESIVAVRAVWEHGNWFFMDWQSPTLGSLARASLILRGSLRFRSGSTAR